MTALDAYHCDTFRLQLPTQLL